MRYSEARGTPIYEKNLKSKISCQTPFKDTTETEFEVAEKYSMDQANRGENLVSFAEIAKLSMNTFTYRSSS